MDECSFINCRRMSAATSQDKDKRSFRQSLHRSGGVLLLCIVVGWSLFSAAVAKCRN